MASIAGSCIDTFGEFVCSAVQSDHPIIRPILEFRLPRASAHDTRTHPSYPFTVHCALALFRTGRPCIPHSTHSASPKLSMSSPNHVTNSDRPPSPPRSFGPVTTETEHGVELSALDSDASMHHVPRTTNRRGIPLDRRASHQVSEKGHVAPAVASSSTAHAPVHPSSGPSSPSSPTAEYTSTSGDTYYDDEYGDWKHRWRSYHPNPEDQTSFLKKPRRGTRSRMGGGGYLPYYRKRRGPTSGGWILRRCLGCIRYRWARILVLVLMGALFALTALWQFSKHYEVQLEFSVFSRDWVRQEVESIRPLKGCWEPQNVSPEYNMTLHETPRRQLLTPGINLRYELACYDFASTVQSFPEVPARDTIFHTYWRSDLAPFDDRQAATLYAFLATQNLDVSKLILWTNGKEQLMGSARLRELVQDWPDHLEVRQFEPAVLTEGTEVDGVLNQMGGIFDRRAWVDGDVVRLLALYQYGGVWIDMDMILTRDVQPLLESEWVMKWDCYGKLAWLLP